MTHQPEKKLFLDIGSSQRCKAGQTVCGDFFLSRRVTGESRIITILADGLGSGIKASVLSTLTASMAAGCAGGNMDARQTAEVILSTLPVCHERGLAYSTFTIVDTDLTEQKVRVIEHENPRCLLLRNNKSTDLDINPIPLSRSHNSSRHHQLLDSRFELKENDRIIVVSDGITQAGLGHPDYPRGWGEKSVQDCVMTETARHPDITARSLAERVMHHALSKDDYTAKDDMSCAVLHYRQARYLVVATGPPYDIHHDAVLAEKIRDFPGKRIICGGTTADIVARELDEKIEVDYHHLDPEVPPPSKINGIDLVTEGTITLEMILRLMEGKNSHRLYQNNAAGKALDLMLNSDRICFIVGNRINNAHHDPTNPRQLDIRRNIVHKICSILENKYLKETSLELI